MIVVLGATAVCAAVWVYLTVGHSRFWSTRVRLPPAAAPREWPSVAIVVPARDEAAVLRDTLASLLAQDYPGTATVVLVDDNSTDGTAAVAARLAEGSGIPLLVTAPGEPPEGWAGKMWALRHGVAVAERAASGPELYLFTDADVLHDPRSLQRLVTAAGDRDLVSQMVLLRTSTRWERLIVPAFVYFFAQLYPFPRVNRPDTRTAASAGGCTMIRADALARIGGIDAIRGAVIDDIALARAVKGSGGRIWLGLTDLVRSIREYPALSDLWGMITRSAYTQLRHSPGLLAVTVLGLALVYLLPPVALAVGLAAGEHAVAGAAALAWVLMTLTYLPMVRHHRLRWYWALSLPVAALLYLAMTVDSARRHRRGRGAAWKGRTYPAQR